jgi:hypothetical protein
MKTDVPKKKRVLQRTTGWIKKTEKNQNKSLERNSGKGAILQFDHHL